LECLNDTTVQQLLDGTLTEAQTRDAQVHLDTCRSCRELLSALARRNDFGGGCAPCSDSCGNGPAGELTRTVRRHPASLS